MLESFHSVPWANYNQPVRQMGHVPIRGNVLLNRENMSALFLTTIHFSFIIYDSNQETLINSTVQDYAISYCYTNIYGHFEPV